MEYTDAEKFGDRIRKLDPEEQENLLWEELLQHQNQIFLTARGLEFCYTIRGGELFVDRKAKSITRGSVVMAFQKALALGAAATGPKKLGTFGASYLYPIFQKLGIIAGKTSMMVPVSSGTESDA